MSLQANDGRPLRRIAVVNRGDAALRLIRAVREYNLEHGTDLVTVVLHSEDESGATFVREADEAVDLGPAQVTLADGRRQLAYVTEDLLEKALVCARADTVWVGWGFVSERPEFAELCARRGLRLVGPDASTMRALGDKVGAKLLAESVDVPVVAWSGGAVADVHDAAVQADRIGYPLMVKAAAGGGGRGIRRVECSADLAEAFRSAAREAESAFGDGSLFLERAVTGARHVEVQVAADEADTVVALGIRDCSVQRRRQKIIEESGVPGLGRAQVAEIKAAAVRLLRATDYTGLGTVEFLLDPATGAYHFMEVNTRLQVEHTVTEEVIGLDLVKLQLELAAGRRLDGIEVREHGYAIEARVTAEDPLDGFRPAPGDIATWQPAVGPGLRMDTGIGVGDPTPSEYDPLLVKVIARGADRAEALARLRRGIAETRLVLKHGATTLGFLRSLLAHPAVLTGGATTELVDDLVADGAPLVEDRAEIALVLVAAALAERRWSALGEHLFSTAARGRGELVTDTPHEVELTHRNGAVTCLVHRLGRDNWSIETPVGPVRVTGTGDTRGERRAVVGGQRVAAHLCHGDDAIEVTLDGGTYRITHGGQGVVTSPLPALVVALRVVPGDQVEAGDVLAVLESMKLETALVAPQAGTVRDVYVDVNAQVAAGQRVVRLETGGETTSAGGRLDALEPLVAASAAMPTPWAPLSMVEGYDAGPIGVVASGVASEASQGRLLNLFARHAAVTGVRIYDAGPGSHGVRGADATARALASPDRMAELVPEEWHDELTALLAEFGTNPEDPWALREGLHRVARAGARLGEVEPVVVDLLRRWLAGEGEPLHEMLDLRDVERVAVSCEATYPLVADLAWAALRRFWLGKEHAEIGTGLSDADAKRLELWRFENFHVEHRTSSGDVHVLALTGRDNEADKRLVALAGVTLSRGDADTTLRQVEAVLLEAFAQLRESQAPVPLHQRSRLNRVVVYVDGVWDVPDDDLQQASRGLAPAARNLGVERVVIRVCRGGRDEVLHLTGPAEAGLSLGSTLPSSSPMRTMSPRQQRLIRLHARGLADPYEIADMLVARNASLSDFPPGIFTELDLDEDGRLVEVDRPAGGNTAGVVVGLIENTTSKHPDGLTRVILLGDPGHGLGALAEPECRRILAALDLAEERGVPVEWFAVSAGARISMTSGTENLDWSARVLRRIVEVTQAGLEVNVVLTGVNVGAQSYFDAEATMLMHTRGILVMTPGSSMVLTGKDALDFAGGVSAEDNVGIGGHARIMGPNGQAQYWAASLQEACTILFRHYEHAYVAPGEQGPRRTSTTDPRERDITTTPHPPMADVDFATIGEVFSDAHNPGRNKPFDMRTLMGAVADADHPTLERWRGMAGAEGTVVWDAHLGGIPACLLGIESRPLPRAGMPSADGPQTWSAATLFPLSSKKLARALNAASGVRPVVVLANLAGFDGSPESLRHLQLEYGAEIGRAVTNFRGPIVFCVVSRYHGGAFVVFSKALNDRLEVLALEGARASVIGGSAASAVVFGREVERRVGDDPRLVAPSAASDRAVADADREVVRAAVRAEMRKALADEFDAIHTVERARQVGSVDRIIAARDLRPSLIESLERGLARDETGDPS